VPRKWLNEVRNTLSNGFGPNGVDVNEDRRNTRSMYTDAIVEQARAKAEGAVVSEVQ
jgi:hypothetical protein